MGLFSSTDLEEAIGKKGLEDLKGIAVDKGTAFLSNKTTSAFVKIGSNEAVASTTQAVAAGIGGIAVAATTIENAQEIVTELGKKIILKATEIVTKEATTCVANYTKKHLTEIQSLPKNISSYAMTVFNENKKSVGDIIKDLRGNSDDDSKKKLEDAEKNQQKNFINKTKEKLNKVSGEISKYTKDITDKISTITNYIEEGPDWVTDQVDKQCQSGVDYINKLLNSQWEKDKEVYDEFIETQGEAVGMKMASEYNKLLEKAQKKIIDKQKTKISAATTKAKTTILGNLLSLAAKTGIL